MSKRLFPWRYLAAGGLFALFAGCSPTRLTTTADRSPSPVAAAAIWYHIEFESDSHSIDTQGELTVADIATFLRQHPNAAATITGKTDTVGSANYNMHLSHERADAVRDALVYYNDVAADRVETRWTGETRLSFATAGNVAELPNRVVDIALH